MKHISRPTVLRTATALLAGLMALAVTACTSEVQVSDDLAFHLFQNKLHTPYVVGSDVSIFVGRSGDDKVSGWSADVSDPSIFVVEQVSFDDYKENMTLECRATAPGETELIVRDEDGHRAARRTIRVEVPDRLDILPAGLIKVRGDNASALDPAAPVRILLGGTATFEVAYYKGEERLYGNGALTTNSDDLHLVASTEQTFLFENREWLQLTPDATGIMHVALEVGGVELANLTVEVVTEDQVSEVELEAEPTTGAEDGHLLYLLGRAYDADGSDIWGVDFQWAVDGVDEQSEGDLFYYYYEEDTDRVVSGGINGHSDEVVVFMSDGGVTSSSNIGCNAAGSGAGLPALLLPLILLLTLRRRCR